MTMVGTVAQRTVVALQSFEDILKNIKSLYCTVFTVLHVG